MPLPFSLLLFSDLACKVPSLAPGTLETISCILLAGDITIGAKSENSIKRCFKKVALQLPEDMPVYFIPGNHDHPYVCNQHEWLPSNFTLMHGRWEEIQVGISKGSEKNTRAPEVILIGFGGASMGLYNNFAFEEEEIESRLSGLFKQVQEARDGSDGFIILLVHDPPRNTALDVNYRGDHVGSIAIRRVIERFQPDLAVAGHIHESPGIDIIGKTTCVNAGEARYGFHALLHVDDTGGIHADFMENKKAVLKENK
ncbi:hypothetical protein GF325_16115 [Candidatus Bathyarchaeota archaeon]|nr:hypothetical protein [Candidatus Bathyarchaeota archaeon]